MENYYRYLPVSKGDESWGLSVLDVGRTDVKASAPYPVRDHPSHHYFDWATGRQLQEYQIIYITRGQGIFESESAGTLQIKAGTIIFLFPGERHRYRPDLECGWDEYWVGIKGRFFDDLVKAGFIKRSDPCVYIGFNDKIFELFDEIIEKSKEETMGYQPLVSGAVVHLMGHFHVARKQHNTPAAGHGLIINKARLLFRANICNPYSPEQAASELNIGYSSFRRSFKSYTGLSPWQYYLQLKIERAKEALRDSALSIKEISVLLNLESGYYFSRIFKEKTGLTPTEFRRAIAQRKEL